MLQVTEREREAHDVLTRHIERTITGSTAVVLSRNHRQDRLEVTTPVPEDSWLRGALISAEPRACLAVRLARPHDSRGPVPAMLTCSICAHTAEDSTCLPLLVGGEVIGSLLVCHQDPLEPLHERRIHESVGRRPPCWPTCACSPRRRHRAATDALTGLPNRRAAQDTLKRMLAQSARGKTPLAAIMVDLDHFKRINDTLGHDCGDMVLAAVGVALPSTVRASDFVARVGGEEFLVLLPKTTAVAALDVAETLRAAVAGLSLTGRRPHRHRQPRRRGPPRPRSDCRDAAARRPTAPSTWPRQTGAIAWSSASRRRIPPRQKSSTMATFQKQSRQRPADGSRPPAIAEIAGAMRSSDRESRS